MLWDGWRVLKLVYSCVIQNIASDPDFMYIVTRSRFPSMPTPYLCCDLIVLLLVDLLRNNDYSWSTPSMVCLWDITIPCFCKPTFSFYPYTFISNWLCLVLIIILDKVHHYTSEIHLDVCSSPCLACDWLWICRSGNMLHL